MVIPLIPFTAAGAISEATATIVEKKILKKRKINFKDYQVYSFLTISLLMIPFLLFFWHSTVEATSIKNIIILLLVIFSALIANLFAFYSMKWEKMTELEPLRLFQPLFVIILAFIFYSSERQISNNIILAAVVASLALIISHIRKHHLKFNKYRIAALLGSLFFAIELVISKHLLSYYNGITFYFIRCSLIFLISLIIFKSKPSSIDKKSWFGLTLASGIWVFCRILIYYGYMHFSVIFTTLIFILSSALIYLFAIIFLKEKIIWRNLVASLIILACVGYAVHTG